MTAAATVLVPRGYRCAGAHCGIRHERDRDRLDLALILSDQPAAAAGVFTQNCVAAAPVHVCRERLPRSDARGIVICSGNANACTGQQGLDDARKMAAWAAQVAGCQPEQMLVCSTGVIGQPLPMPRIEVGIGRAAGALAATPTAFEHAARAILTTDTCMKVSGRRLTLAGQDVHISGFAKGAAMIGPNMATMLAFILTDASVAEVDLAHILRSAVDRSFNCISVEGHTSTNDTVLLLANGAGPRLAPAELGRFAGGVQEVCTDLAKAIAADAEGATHLVTIDVEGTRDDDEARRIARCIANSALVKTALYGADPNWGRIVSAAGYAGVRFEETQLSLWLGDLLLYHAGTPQPFDAATAAAYLRNHRDISMRLRLTLGTGRCTFHTCDLTPEYVRLNADYTT